MAYDVYAVAAPGRDKGIDRVHAPYSVSSDGRREDRTQAPPITNIKRDGSASTHPGFLVSYRPLARIEFAVSSQNLCRNAASDAGEQVSSPYQSHEAVWTENRCHKGLDQEQPQSCQGGWRRASSKPSPSRRMIRASLPQTLTSAWLRNSAMQ